MSLITTTFADHEDEAGLPTRRAPLFDDPEPSGHGTFTNAVGRGIDSTQAGLYAFAKTLSDAVGVDVVSKWAQKGIDANVQEIMDNPPEIRSWDDVDSFADFGTYVLEALGEQAPQLAMQFAGAKGGGKLARAALGKAMKRKLGEKAFANYRVQAAIKGSAEEQALIKRETLGAVAGAMTVGTAQNIGETKMNLDDAGVVDNSLEALMGGAIKGALDTVSFGKISGLSKKLGVSPAELPNVLAQQAKRVGLTGAGTVFASQIAKEGVTDALVEGATETAQSFVDQVIVHAEKPEGDLFSDRNIADLRESFVKGGLLGGIIGPIGTIREKYPAYAKARQAAQQGVDISVANLPAPAFPVEPAAAAPAPAEPIAPKPVPVEPAAPTEPVAALVEQPVVVNEDAQILASQQADEHLAVGLSTLAPVVRQQMIDAIQSGHPEADSIANELRNIGRTTIQSERQQMVADRAEQDGRTTVFKENVAPAEDLAAGAPAPAAPITAAPVVLEDRPDAALAAENYNKTGLMPSEEIPMAAEAAANKASMLQRTSATLPPAAQRIIDNNIIDAVGPDGKAQQLSLTDLTYAGMNSLSSVKTSQELSEPEFRVRGLEYALGEMIANGWDVRSAFDARGRLRPDLAITVGNVKKSTVAPNNDVRQVQQERDNRQYQSAPNEYMPDPPSGAAESVRQDMALQIEDHQNRALDTIETWAANPEGSLSDMLGTTLRQRGEDAHPAIAQLETAVRGGKYTTPAEILDSPEVSDLLAESERKRELLAEPDYNPYSSDDARQQAVDDSASEHQMAIAQDDSKQDATGTAFSRIREIHGDAAERDFIANPKTKRRGLAEEKVAALNHELKQLKTAQREPGQKVVTIRERSDRIKSVQQELVAARQEMDEATKEDNRLASPAAAPTAHRAGVATAPNPAVEAVAQYKAKHDARLAARQKLDTTGEELGLGHLTDAMNKVIDRQTGADIQNAKTKAVQAALPGGTAAVNPDEYLANFTAPAEIATAGGVKVFSNSPGITRADAEFTAGLFEHFNMKGVDSVRIDESPTVSDVSVGVIDGQLVMIVPTLPKKMTGAARQAKIAEALGRNIFNRYMRFDADYHGPQKAQQYRAFMERAYMRDTGKNSVDEKAFRKWFGEKTAGYVKELVAKTKFTETDKFGNPAADPLRQTTKEMERAVPGITEAPAGIADKIFRELAGKIHAIWKKNADKLAKYKSNREVNAFINRVVREDSTSTWWDTARVDSENAESPAPVVDAAGDGTVPPSPPPGGQGTDEPPPRGAQAFANTLANSMDLASWWGIRNLFSAGSQLRAAWENLGLLVEQPTNTAAVSEKTGHEAYHTAVGTRGMEFMGAFNTILHDHLRGMADVRIQQMEKAAFNILTTGTSNASFDKVRDGVIPEHLSRYNMAELEFALALHDYHDQIYKYQVRVNKNIPYVDGYFHRNYNMEKILAEREKFDAILAKHSAMDAYEGMISNYITRKDTLGPLQPPAKHMKSRKIHDQALIDDLISHGFLNANPIADMMKYSKAVVSRTEFDRIAPLIDKEFTVFTKHTLGRVQSGELTPVQAASEIARVQGLLNNALGLLPIDKSSAWYRPLEELRALTGLNSLLFGGLSGMVEAGMVNMKTRGVVTTRQFTNQMFNNIRDREAMLRFAQSMGVIHSDMHASLGSMLFADADSFDGPISKWIPKMLELTGNEFMAQNMRVLSASVGKEYLVSLADLISQGKDPKGQYIRQLRELSSTITPEMVYAWRDAGYPSWASIERTPENRALYSAAQQANHAIARFVQETVVNPTAADTPPWARNPWGAFLFQLKGFTMTANKRMLMGAYREIQHQVNNGTMTEAAASAAVWALPSAMLLLFLAAGQEELRQRLRSLGEEGVLENYHHDPVKIASVLGERAGITNLPFIGAVLHPSVNNIAFELGPTASKALQLSDDLGKGDTVGAALHMTPGLSQLPGARQAVYKTLETAGVRS